MNQSELDGKARERCEARKNMELVLIPGNMQLVPSAGNHAKPSAGNHETSVKRGKMRINKS